jgi:queuosine precursor transporter
MKTLHKLDLLIALYLFCIITSELMGAKTFPLLTIGGWTLNQSVSIFTVPLVFTINDVITEVYGRERTRSIIRAGLVVVALVLLFSLLATALPASSRFAGTEAAYDTIFGLSARFSFASLLAFAVAEFTDVYVFVKIREMLGSKGLWIRNNVSNFVAQLIDTVIFMFVAFWAFDQSAGSNFSFIMSLLVPYWIVKCLMSVIETPFVYLGVKWLKSDQPAMA